MQPVIMPKPALEMEDTTEESKNISYCAMMQD